MTEVTTVPSSMLTTAKRSLRDTIARVGLADLAIATYGLLMRMDPRTLWSNAKYRREGAPDKLPIPPDRLVFLVAGSTDISWFLRGGSLGAASIRDVLHSHDMEVDELGAILDFGAGCGRVLRYWHGLSSTRVCGTDYNRDLVEWCRANLPFVEAEVNELAPPLKYQDGEFDLVYALSVFTHLTSDLQYAWIEELTRIVRPGGHLVITTQGRSYLARLNAQELAQFNSGGLVVKNNLKSPGSNTCAAYHPFAFVKGRLAKNLEVVDYIEEGARGNPRQDLYLLRKPTGHGG